MPLIFGINSWALTPTLNTNNAKTVIGRLAELDMPGSERVLEYLVFDTLNQQEDASYIAEVAADNGFSHVSVCGFNPGDPKIKGARYSVSDAKDERDAALLKGYSFIDIARDVTPKGGKSRLCGPFYRQHQDMAPMTQQRYDHLVEHLAKLAERAYQEGVELDPEVINRFEFSGPCTAMQMLELITAVKQKAKSMEPFPMKSQVDIFHCYVEGQPIEQATQFAMTNGMLGTVHLGDSNRLAVGSGTFKGQYRSSLCNKVFSWMKDDKIGHGCMLTAGANSGQNISGTTGTVSLCGWDLLA
jgi:sugar phosphate isomerase/epimerase